MKPGFVNLVLCWLLTSCATEIPKQLLDEKQHLLQQDGKIVLSGNSSKEAKIHYLGVGGFVIDYEGSRIYTAPFYTNPSLLRSMPLMPMSANETCIDRSFPDHLTDADFDETAVLVGHAHYDHLMDLPHLLDKQLANSQVFGSVDTRRLVNRSLGKRCDDSSRTSIAEAGKPKTFGKIRVSPIASHHAPHFMGITAMTGKASCNSSAPKTAWGWKMGEVLAYVIDFLNDAGEIEFRVFYQDSASDESKIELNELEPAADVALIVMANFHAVKNYPASIVEATKAKLYIAGHWEDFFSGCKQQPPLITRGTNALKFVRALESAMSDHNQDAEWRMLFPDTALTINFETK